MTELMLCPKCGQNYPDPGQRFCDTDGTRLVPDDLSARLNTGVFRSILPQAEKSPNIDLEATLRGNVPVDRRTVDEMRSDSRMEEMFYEVDVVSESRSTTSASKPIGRRVLPNEIPAGHVDLYERHQVPQHLNDFQPDSPPSFVGKTVKGRYRVTEMIGEDNSGYAYFADDVLGDGRRVVVRILAGFEDEDEVTRSIYAEERVALSHLNHPNVAKILDSGSYSNGTEYVISDHLDGLSVADLLSIHGKFEAARAARIVKQAAYAITDVQREGVLHRDIRGANITVLPLDGLSEQVTVSNFGVAGSTPNSDNFRYQSPEVLRGKIPNVASDTYSLAVVAYEMLTGRLPFDGNSPTEIVAEHRSQNIIPVSETRRDVSKEVDGVFARAFAVEPRDRFLSARDLGEALTIAVSSKPEATKVESAPAEIAIKPMPTAVSETKPKAIETTVAKDPSFDGPSWQRRSPEPPVQDTSPWLKITAGVAAVLLVLAGLAWYFLINRQPPVEQINANGPSITVPEGNTAIADVVRPPLPRQIPQPENTNYYENLKQNLSGDLLRNFVGFKMYYPTTWKLNAAEPSATSTGRGKYMDISRLTPEGKLMEQMLVSYYPSKGTIADDRPNFPKLLKEANETLKKFIPNYQMLSAEEVSINGDWKAYEIKFQGSGPSDTGDRINVWGRRLFMPASRQGVRNGFEITMLATTYAPEVRSVDDVGVKGDLAGILYTFEPSQNF